MVKRSNSGILLDMFIQVKLLNKFNEPLLYAVGPEHANNDLVGSVVKVPLQNRIESALVIQQFDRQPSWATFKVRPIIGPEQFPADPHYRMFIKQLASYYCIDPVMLISRIKQFISQEQQDVSESHDHTSNVQEPLLTSEQLQASDYVCTLMDTRSFQSVLLHGVTGSGKTEVYKKIIKEAIRNNKSVILMLPEVTLALQFERILKQQLPQDIRIATFHSATKASDKKRLWQDLLDETPLVVVGVHMPLLLPINNLGCIIVDEEHEVGYQEKKHPKINSKEAAIMRARASSIPILLGSATPSISSLYNVEHKGWKLFKLTQRFAGNFPTVRIVQLPKNPERKNFWISRELELGIKDRLARNEQTIVFLNRRGFSFFVQCKQCTHSIGCSSCSVSLTLHEDNTLSCHYCSFKEPMPLACPSCRSKDFLKKGVGTQQMVSILQTLFPQARIARADLDTTSKKREWQKTVEAIHKGSIDIIVGTQTITKGYHFPKVTLVGVIWADLTFNFPIYNASETALQQLIQVAGRAGRQSPESMVIIQTMADHHLLSYVDEQKYPDFFATELETRRDVNYPPCTRFAEIEIRHSDESLLEEESMMIALKAQELAESQSTPVMILGPAKPPVSKIKHMHSRKLYLKSDSISALISVYQHLTKIPIHAQLFFTPNPIQ